MVEKKYFHRPLSIENFTLFICKVFTLQASNSSDRGEGLQRANVKTAVKLITFHPKGQYFFVSIVNHILIDILIQFLKKKYIGEIIIQVMLHNKYIVFIFNHLNKNHVFVYICEQSLPTFPQVQIAAISTASGQIGEKDQLQILDPLQIHSNFLSSDNLKV